MMKNFLSYSICSLMILGLSACTSLMPEYERPQSPVATHFENSSIAGGTVDQVASTLVWREIFTDPRLQQVIAQALANNRDLRVVMLNIESARAEYRIQSAEALPSISATASQTNSRSGTASNAATTHNASLSVGFTSWELDLFGRIRSLKAESLENYFALQETQRSTQMSLIAEVAADWLNVMAYQQKLQFAEQVLASQEQTQRLTYARYKEGIASALDYEEVKTSVNSAKADIASYRKQLQQAKNALDLIVGAEVVTQNLPASTDRLDDIKLASIPGNLSSTVLFDHPDVLYAEHMLKSANADIGAARAAFFPTISLTATTGRSSTQLGQLFASGGTSSWSFIPSITLPIFQAGELKASLDQAKIQKNIYIAQYEKAIQTAFSDVADALTAREHISNQVEAQKDLVQSSYRTYYLTEARYKEGIDDYLSVLTAQRTWYNAQQDFITLLLEEATNRVTLYKVLGGGADS
ncbi:efflux transporter outer membrane subunit [Acinetobacter qingfengensis]|uniref:Transporter n=1 Tax=Acinetobacter qingfengensis TaxID=1262585 RepID=A0A1E7R992_9GAMM|nr:efflux transporter outer membrane subunit [Acinetobacter qingfengensis]KAA8735422.1 efflux transporter outer membrane subunit [Acinetobacter qingfengensis]OEY95930.1 transporter [Acinetobacter qingfengensis]